MGPVGSGSLPHDGQKNRRWDSGSYGMTLIVGVGGKSVHPGVGQQRFWPWPGTPSVQSRLSVTTLLRSRSAKRSPNHQKLVVRAEL